jgi:cytochrome c oxidase cbb3-type subunit III
MSDFTSNFWPIFVSAITVLGIAACLILLWASGKTKAMTANDNTTGHVWDGDLREMNNPLPRWWVGLFVITVLFSIFYLYLYPGLGTYAGQAKWSSQGQYDAEVAKGEQEVAPLYQRYAGMDVAEVQRDPKAMAIGESLFLNNCAQCHGSDAHGGKGFPNLADSDWLYGSEPARVEETIAKGRIGMMPPMAAAVGTPEDVKNVANYVLSLSGSPHDSLRASLGKSKFAACAACHGADGKGNPALGSANLTDDVWLHGYGEGAIIAMVNNGKTNQMPAWEKKFSPAQIHLLTAYVLSLSNSAVAAK